MLTCLSEPKLWFGRWEIKDRVCELRSASRCPSPCVFFYSILTPSPAPSAYWGMAFGWCAFVFCMAEARKWIIYMYPSGVLARYNF